MYMVIIIRPKQMFSFSNKNEILLNWMKINAGTTVLVKLQKNAPLIQNWSYKASPNV